MIIGLLKPCYSGIFTSYKMIVYNSFAKMLKYLQEFPFRINEKEAIETSNRFIREAKCLGYDQRKQGITKEL